MGDSERVAVGTGFWKGCSRRSSRRGPLEVTSDGIPEDTPEETSEGTHSRRGAGTVGDREEVVLNYF